MAASRHSKLKRRRKNYSTHGAQIKKVERNEPKISSSAVGQTRHITIEENQNKNESIAQTPGHRSNTKPRESSLKLACTAKRFSSKAQVGFSLPSLSKIVGLNFDAKQTTRYVTNDIDSCIQQQYQLQSQMRNKIDEPNKNNFWFEKGGHVQRTPHSIFGVINSSSDDKSTVSEHANNAPRSKLLLPSNDFLLGKESKHRINNSSHSTYQDGDGTCITLQSLRFPSPFSSKAGLTKEYKTNSDVKRKIQIVSKRGATIRQNYLINETDKIFGKLRKGDVREIITSRWLYPSTRASDHDVDGIGVDDPDDQDEDLITVKRYQIILLPQDVEGYIPFQNEMHGWISDRSRLKDDQFLIAQEV